MFLGVTTLNLDAKGRLAIPAKHRESLAECCGSRVAVTLNPLSKDKCLWLYPDNEWRDVALKLSRLPAMDAKSQALKRLLLGHAAELELDAQGRILLSNELRSYAELGKRVVLVGQVNKFEIWDEEVWQGNRERWRDVLADDAAGLSEQLGEITL
ncbi:MAG: division/cell wall cluster transcriptional repressor MraZ [Gammaproteobacteria bacterium]|nr:division/cell wall cluster transcriptional repressor MraZ [Gammaproteobacteria bacterium]MCB1924851.1 division/cell wall cluster transcriptional repressor MraZ [Gammaproteobacteria bacterium]